MSVWLIGENDVIRVAGRAWAACQTLEDVDGRNVRLRVVAISPFLFCLGSDTCLDGLDRN